MSNERGWRSGISRQFTARWASRHEPRKSGRDREGFKQNGSFSASFVRGSPVGGALEIAHPDGCWLICLESFAQVVRKGMRWRGGDGGWLLGSPGRRTACSTSIAATFVPGPRPPTVVASGDFGNPNGVQKRNETRSGSARRHSPRFESQLTRFPNRADRGSRRWVGGGCHP